MTKIKKLECYNCLHEFEGNGVLDAEDNVYCSKECRTEYRHNLNEELRSAGE